MTKQTYTQEQLDIAIINYTQSAIAKTLDRLENRLDKLDSKVDNHFHWMVGLMFGLYTLGISGLVGAIGHAYGWF